MIRRFLVIRWTGGGIPFSRGWLVAVAVLLMFPIVGVGETVEKLQNRKFRRGSSSAKKNDFDFSERKVID